MSSFTPVNPGWKLRMRSQTRRATHKNGDNPCEGEDYTDDEEDLGDHGPTTTTRAAHVHETTGRNEDSLAPWEGMINVGQLYGFSGHKETGCGRVSKTSVGRGRRKKGNKRLEMPDRNLTQNLRVRQQQTAEDLVKIDDPIASPVTQQPSEAHVGLFTNISPLNVQLSDAWAAMSEPSTSIELSEDELGQKNSSNDHVPTHNDAQYHGTASICDKQFDAAETLPSPPQSTNGSMDEWQNTTVSIIDTDHSDPVQYAKISCSRINNGTSSATLSAHTKETPNGLGYLADGSATSLLNLRFRTSSSGISRAFAPKDLPPLLSPKLPFGLSVGRLSATHVNNRDVHRCGDTSEGTARGRNSSQREAEMTRKLREEEGDQRKYEDTASNNWKAAVVSDGPASFTRQAVLRAATRLAKTHTGRKAESNRKVSFDDKAAREALAEWKGIRFDDGERLSDFD